MSKKKEKEAKTNAMRLLDMLHVPYRHYSYGCREFVDAWHTAQALGLPAEKMYKTLVTEGAPRQYYVFVIPIGGAFLEEGGACRGSQGSFHASCEGYYHRNGVRARRLHRSGNEEEVSRRD